MVHSQTRIDGQGIAACVDRFRARRPHVHCITNTVAQHFTANVLLAAGGTPSMTIAAEEVADFVSMADALLINLGTMDPERTRAVDIAVDTAIAAGKPWVLDPVFVQASPIRLALAKTLLGKKPSLVRANAGEGKAMFDVELDQGSLKECSDRFGPTIAMTGKADLIGNSKGTARVENGSPMMERITAMGCALTALMAGFLAVEDNHLQAATSAIAFFGLAGEVADQNSNGPGTFVPHFLDALANLSTDEIEAGVKVS